MRPAAGWGLLSSQIVFVATMPIVKAPRRAPLCEQILGLSQLIAADLPKGIEDDVEGGQLKDCGDDPEIGQ